MRTKIGIARKKLGREKHASLFRDTVPDEENKVFLTLTLDRRLPTSAENQIKFILTNGMHFKNVTIDLV